MSTQMDDILSPGSPLHVDNYSSGVAFAWTGVSGHQTPFDIAENHSGIFLVGLLPFLWALKNYYYYSIHLPNLHFPTNTWPLKQCS